MRTETFSREDTRGLEGKLEAQERFWRGRMKEYEDRLERERMENKESLEQLRLEIAEERGKLARQAKRRRKLKKRKKELENQQDLKIIQPHADDCVPEENVIIKPPADVRVPEENVEKPDPTQLQKNGKVQVIKVSERMQVQKILFSSNKQRKNALSKMSELQQCPIFR